MATDSNITALPAASDTHVDTRDFRLVSCSIIASDGTSTEVGPSVTEVMVRQDLYLGFMSGELLFTDGNDMIARLGIHGGEYMYLHFRVPEQDIELKKAFRIYKIGNRTPTDSQQKYIIYFMSDEMFISSTTKISRAYNNTTVSTIAKDVMENYLEIDPSRIFVDQTSAAVSYIIPNLRPAEALNWLATRAYDTSNSSGYFFYEDLEGFHFASLQSIYKRGTRIKVPFTLDNKRGERALDMDKFAIDEYLVKRDFDILSTVSSGGYAMKLTAIDTNTRTVQTYEYNPESIKKLYDNSPMSNQKDLFSKTDTHVLTYTASNGIENWIRHVPALSLLNSSLVQLTLPGNMGLLVGTLISLRIPYTITPASGDMWDKQKSGKYLVIAVNHKFDLINQKFTSLLWVSRDSQPESLPAYSPTLPDKIARLNSQ